MEAFSLAEEHPPMAGLTISSKINLQTSVNNVTCFSLGKGTSISAEAYDRDVIYIGNGGSGDFAVGPEGGKRHLSPGEILVIRKNTLCGVETGYGLVYTEVISKEDLKMNDNVKSGEVFRLADLVPYQEGSIVNMDVVANDALKFVVMAFDVGTGLSEHRAPGDAIVFALEGKATIGYEGKDYPIEAGQQFRFAKNGLHSVKADGRFKMALLLTLK